MKLKKLGVYFIVAMLMVSFVLTNTGIRGYAETENLIPEMTSNTAPSGIASASSFYDNSLVPYMAFNHKGATFHGYWCSKSVESWLSYEFPQEKIVNKYTITQDYTNSDESVVNKRHPKNWTFEGLNESTNQWDVLDTRTNITDWKYNVKKEFSFNNSKGYKKYRINITENNGDSIYSAIGEMEMMGSSVSVTTPDSPENLTAAAGDEEVGLSWDEVEDADSYIIKRSETEGGPYTIIEEDITGTSYTDRDVENGTTYYYVVSAVIDGDESDDSNEALATPEGSSSGSGDKAILRITMQNGKINEYDLSINEVDDFIDWFEDRDDPYYIIEKDYNIGPFESRKDYIVADKILQFEVMEYED
ncbi:hypothetical protein [Wukongibacter sp. M2B1]|uniref:hypothetical protein n=1 Tax=Wukongibacter sp. M2B1 TaxID=3088895 RepID=UPI003D7A2E8F